MGSTDGRDRLYALLRCDMVSSTELLAAQGIDAAIVARRHAVEIIESSTAAGEVIDTRGDGMLLAFESATAAVAAAWSVQQQATRVVDFDLRVAVSVHEHEDGADAAANIERSSQLEGACPAGAVVVDDRTHKMLADVHGATFHVVDLDVYQVDAFPLGWAPTAEAQVTLRSVLMSDGSHEAVRAMSERSVREHNGQILDTNGHGHLAVFESCRHAIAAAQMMQAEIASSNLRSDTECLLSVDVGIAVGEVTVTASGQGFGLAVVEAARLADQARRSQILASGPVCDLAGLEPSQIQAVGSRLLKGLVHAVDVFDATRREIPELAAMPLTLQHQHRFPMIGRHHEYDLLARRWSDVLHGVGVLVMVSGEEGVGKTRLVRELAHDVHRAGAIVLYGACYEGPESPYSSVGMALGAAAHLDSVLASAATGSGPLARVLTSQNAPLPASGGTAYESADQGDLFDEVADALARLAVQRPVLLVIDDVQWAEPDTTNLIRHIAQSAAGSRIAIVTTCRSEALAGARAASLVQPLPGSRRVDQVSLGRLTPDQVVSLLESQTESPLRGDEIALAAKIAEVTGGSPLYIEELLVHLAETDVVVHDEAQGWSLTAESDSIPIPASVLDLVSRRVSRMGKSATRLLAVAAMIGATFDVEVLADVTEQSIDSILDIADEAEIAQLLRSVEPGQTYGFSDEIVRSAFLANIRPSRRARVHQQVAESIERIYPNRIDQLATHWSAAAGSAARTKAVHYLRLSAERAMASAAWESAGERQRSVLDMLQADGSEDIDMLGEVHLALGLALRLAGAEEHRKELMTAADLARRARNGDQLFRCGAAMMRPGAWYPEAGVVDTDIVAICEDALLLLAADDPLRVRVMAALATNLAYDHDHERRTKLVAEAQTLAQASGDLHMIGTMYAAELTSSHEPERFERRREIAEEVRRIGRATGDQSLLITGSLFIVLDEIGKGELATVQSMLDELESLVEASREYFTQYLVAYVGSALAVARCDDDAEQQIEKVRSRFENHPLDTFGMSLLQNGCIAMGRGTLSGLLLEIVKASTTWDEGWGAKWNYGLSRAHIDAGDYDAALRAVESKPEPDRDFYWLSSMCQLALLGRVLGLTDVSERVVRELTPFRGRLAIIGLGIGISGQVSTALAHAYIGLGQHDLAQELYRESIVQADRVGFPYFATEARRYLAQDLHRQDPHSPEVHVLCEQVVAHAQRFGFAEELREARALLAQQ